MSTELQVKERPILFSTSMVQSILSDTKTQTRRTKALEHFSTPKSNGEFKLNRVSDGTASFYWIANDPEYKDRVLSYVTCPYGKPGDRLWVRETWAYGYGIEPFGRSYIYKADIAGEGSQYTSYRFSFDEDELDAVKFKPSIHMPREASRILLEITDIRVERLQDISDADAIAEGIDFRYDHLFQENRYKDYWNEGQTWREPVSSFASLICKVNKDQEAFVKNPWVWVLEFMKVEQSN